MNLAQAHQRLMQNPEFSEEWYKPNMLGEEIKLLRKMKGWTQQQLADKVGTTQSGIARMENSDTYPYGYVSLALLHKVARALGYYLKIEFKEDFTHPKKEEVGDKGGKKE